jgi:serine/threonine protein kinase
MSGEHEYELLERIGVGGMAEVFRANSLGAEGFERPIAIKRILPNLAEDEDFVKMFIDEAKIAVQLSHPNIVGIFDLGRFGDDYFIAMELVYGRDLRQIQDREAQLGRRVPMEIALHASMKTCEALHHAHFKGGGSMMGESPFIIHRDVSPQNVLVSYDGQVKVTDFGLAKAAGRAVQTQAGIIKGKLAYMSPEQLTAVPIDQRSDVFAAGTLLWELLTGERLFLGKNDRETIQNVFAAKVAPPRTLDPSIPPELDRVVMKALAKDRDQRYGTAQEFHDDLEETAYGMNAMIGAPSVSAYMRALFPEAEVSGSTRRRDPRAATNEIRLSDVAGSNRLRAAPAPRPFDSSDAEELDEELDEVDAEEIVDEDVDESDVEAAPDSIMPPEPMLDDVDPEESRKTVPPAGLLDLVTPSADPTLLPVTQPLAARDPEPGSAMRSTREVVTPTGGSGPRAVPPVRAPEPIISQQYARFGEDDFEDRTTYGAPSFAEPPHDAAVLDPTRATLEYQGDPYELAAQLQRALEPLGPDTSGNRLAPEEMLTTKANVPSSELLARARREREERDEAPRDTIPPPADDDDRPSYEDRTSVGGAPQPVVRSNEWEDETTPIGSEKKKQQRR